MQNLLNSISRNIQINGVNYADCNLKEGDYVTAVISNIVLEDLSVNRTYTFILNDNYIGESTYQLNLCCKWNRGKLIYDKVITGKVVSYRNNMIKVEIEHNDTMWILKDYIETVY